jgi:hypothetical protein
VSVNDPRERKKLAKYSDKADAYTLEITLE